MSKNNELKLLLILMSIGFALNLILGFTGSFFPPESFTQITCWQIGDTSAIMASILASRYVGTRGSHIVPSGYILLGIAYGVSFASSTFNSINEDKMATVILPLLPALLLIGFGKFFPGWIRIISILACIPFFIIYLNVINGTYAFENISNTIAYIGIQTLGIIWTVFIWRDYKATRSNL